MALSNKRNSRVFHTRNRDCNIRGASNFLLVYSINGLNTESFEDSFSTCRVDRPTNLIYGLAWF